MNLLDIEKKHELSYCHGCRSEKGCKSSISSYVGLSEFNVLCPCSKCLIKSMCDVPCDKFRKFSNNIRSMLSYERSRRERRRL